MKIKTIQWNIGGGLCAGREADPLQDQSYTTDGLDDIILFLQKEKPDIITLQEAHDGTTNQIKAIAENLALPYFVSDRYGRSHLAEDAWLCQSIISRFPIIKHDFSLLPNPDLTISFGDKSGGKSHNKGITTVICDLNERQLTVKTLHLVPFHRTKFPPTDKCFLPLWKALNDDFDDTSEKLLIQGDFNIDQSSLSDFIPQITSNILQEIPQRKATTAKGKRHDHLLYRGLSPLNSQVEKKMATDHYPLVSTLIID